MSLESLVESLPEALRKQYQSICGNFEPRKRRIAVAAAKHLVAKLGRQDITFKRLLALPDGHKFYVDLYCGGLNLYVICIADSSFEWLTDRVEEIKRADPKAKVGVAIPYWLAWTFAELHVETNELWVVEKDGETYNFNDWLERRRKQVEEVAVSVARKLYGLQLYREEVKKIFEGLFEGKQSLCATVSGNLAELLKAIGLSNISWLATAEYEIEKEEMIATTRLEMKLIQREMLNSLIELANVILARYTPFTLSLTEKGSIFIYQDPEMDEWLNWGTDGVACRLGQRRECEIIAKAIETAQKEGKLTPKKPGELFFLASRQGEWPPQTITVPRQTLEKVLQIIQTIEKRLEIISENLN
ncbi:MAG: hypothetical protein ACPLKQ_05815 [Candidatus Bathyarchaeales archaeon]